MAHTCPQLSRESRRGHTRSLLTALTLHHIVQVVGMSLDTASLTDVKRFVKQVKEAKQPPDIIICNAAIMCPEERQVSEDGFEYQFACNYLGAGALRIIATLVTTAF